MDRIPQRPRLLVVDDDFDMTNTLKDLFQDFNYDVDVAHDGVQALGKIKGTTYAAVLCDYQMPRMNGRALFEALCRSHPEVAARFVFITANARVPEVAQFFGMLRLPVIEKPFRSAEVVHLVDKVVQANKN